MLKTQLLTHHCDIAMEWGTVFYGIVGQVNPPNLTLTSSMCLGVLLKRSIQASSEFGKPWFSTASLCSSDRKRLRTACRQVLAQNVNEYRHPKAVTRWDLKTNEPPDTDIEWSQTRSGPTYGTALLHPSR